MADIGHDWVVLPLNVLPTDHAVIQMRRRRITWEHIRLVLELGVHVDGLEEGTLEVCAEVDGRPITVVYDEIEYRFRGVFVIVTVIRRKCRE
jgi:hypothetical protein